MKGNESVAFVFQRAFFIDSVAIVGKMGNIKGFFLTLCGKDHHIFRDVSVAGVLGEGLNGLLVGHGGFHRFGGSRPVDNEADDDQHPKQDQKRRQGKGGNAFEHEKSHLSESNLPKF